MMNEYSAWPGSLGRDVLFVVDPRIVTFDVAGGPARARRVFLPAQDGPDDVLGGDRHAVVVGDGNDAVGQPPRNEREASEVIWASRFCSIT